MKLEMSRATLLLVVCLLAWQHGSWAHAPGELEGPLKVRHEWQQSGFHWMTPQQYSSIDKKNNTKPFLFTFTSEHCGVCRALHEHFAIKEDRSFLSAISSQFNAVLIHNNYGSNLIERQYSDSGNYVPRTIFADPDGTMRDDVQSRNGSPRNPFFFLPSELLWQMSSLLNDYSQASGQCKYQSGLKCDL